MLRTCIWALVLLGYFTIPLIVVADDVRREPGIYWAFSVMLMVLALSLATRPSLARRLVLTLLGTAFVLVNVALTVSFASQGTAFNSAFFAHLDLTTLKIALQTEFMNMAVLGLYVLATPFVLFLVLTAMRPVFPAFFQKVAAPVAAVLSLWVNYPITAYTEFRQSTAQTSNRLSLALEQLQQGPTGSAIAAQENALNLVVIYAESLEETFFDDALFPDLVPNLTRLASEARWFRNVQQYPGTGWTIGGIVSSQCGVPLLSELGGNDVLNETDNPFSDITCLAEYLKQAGYRTAYLGGASLAFAGKGNFLRDNGYDVVLGIDELPDATAHKWGMYDTSLFEHARTVFDGLAESPEPFHLTVLTLDTHGGTPSPGCPTYPAVTSVMLDSVQCADGMIAEFVAHVRTSPVGSQTVIAVVSDHLLIRGDIKPVLEEQDRKVLFFMLHPDLAPGQHAGPSSHFDIGPTLLDATGLSGFSFAFGHSLLSHETGRAQQQALTEADMQAFKVENLLHRESN